MNWDTSATATATILDLAGKFHQRTNEKKMDLSAFENDNLKPFLVESEIPEVSKAKPCCMGIDEAGRGPVLGKTWLGNLVLRPVAADWPAIIRERF